MCKEHDLAQSWRPAPVDNSVDLVELRLLAAREALADAAVRLEAAERLGPGSQVTMLSRLHDAGIEYGRALAAWCSYRGQRR